MNHEELLSILNALEHLRELPKLKRIKDELERRLQKIEDDLAPKEEYVEPKAIPSGG